jgi:hypothetical protein
MLEPLIEELKQKVLSSLETNIYEQAVAQNLVDTALRSLIESAIERLQIQAPGAMGGLGAVVGLFGSIASQFGSLGGSLGLGEQARALIQQFEVDKALRDSVIRGLTRYLEENGAHMMQVAVDATLSKLTATPR